MKILILAKDFPPVNTIGAQRPAAWFKYFNDAGHCAWVVTSSNSQEVASEDKILRVATDLYGLEKGKKNWIRKIRSFFEIWLPYILPRISRYYSIFSGAKRIVSDQKPDIIIATGEPFVLFKFAHNLSHQTGIPWLADYRDNWSNEPTLQFRSIFRTLYSWYFGIFEKRVVRSAALITTVGEPTRSRIKQIIPKKRVELIPNGHHVPADFNNKAVQKESLKISFIGRLYKHRNPSLFLSGLLKWKNANPSLKIELHFYGLGDFPQQVGYLHSLVPEIKNLLFIHQSLPYHDMLNLVSDSNAFLMLADKSLPLTNGKLYDYLGLNRPIILCPDDHSIFRDFILNENCGYIADSAEDVVELLNTMYHHIGEDEFFTTAIPSEKYSREKSSQKLLHLIQELCAAS